MGDSEVLGAQVAFGLLISLPQVHGGSQRGGSWLSVEERQSKSRQIYTSDTRCLAPISVKQILFKVGFHLYRWDPNSQGRILPYVHALLTDLRVMVSTVSGNESLPPSLPQPIQNEPAKLKLIDSYKSNWQMIILSRWAWASFGPEA